MYIYVYMAEGIGIHTSGGLASTDSRRKPTEFQIRADVAVLSLKAENSKFLCFCRVRIS